MTPMQDYSMVVVFFFLCMNRFYRTETTVYSSSTVFGTLSTALTCNILCHHCCSSSHGPYACCMLKHNASNFFFPKGPFDKWPLLFMSGPLMWNRVSNSAKRSWWMGSVNLDMVLDHRRPNLIPIQRRRTLLWEPLCKIKSCLLFYQS